jgi:hypothetical protein
MSIPGNAGKNQNTKTAEKSAFCVITRRVVLISYRHFGKTYSPHLFFLFLTPVDGTERLSGNVDKKLPLLAA